MSFLFAGYSYECSLNSKLDEQLCSNISAKNEVNLVKVNIILKRPVIEMTDQYKGASSEEFSKYCLDSLSRYLDANKEIIQSIVIENVLYTVASSQNNLERLTQNNLLIDFKISAAATMETLLSLAEKYSIISRLETYEEFGPTADVQGNKTFKQQNTETSAYLKLNGKKIGLQTLSGTIVKNVTIYDLHGRTVRNFISQEQNGNDVFTTNLPQSSYILSVKNNLGQISNNLFQIP
jgi:hypothetical protein